MADEFKTLESFEIKDEDRGEVMAVVATLNAVDHDRDVILPGAIKDGASVMLSAYGHSVPLGGEAPVGKGKITVNGDKALLHGRFFMSTDRGREAFAVVKEMGPEQQWSIGFRTVKDASPDDTWKAQGAKRMIERLDVFEVSPVFRGASLETGTLAVKEQEAEPGAWVHVKEGDEGVTVTIVRPDPAPDAAAEAEALRVAEEVEAKRVLEAETKRVASEAAVEFDRFRRTMRNLGYAA